jgi:hypothetical protein
MRSDKVEEGVSSIPVTHEGLDVLLKEVERWRQEKKDQGWNRDDFVRHLGSILGIEIGKDHEQAQ